MKDHSSKYSEKNLWGKMFSVAVKAGKKLISIVLELYYCMKDPDTPYWAKTVIIGALGYFISPIDAIPDLLPGGYIDDYGVLASAFATVAAYIKEEHKEMAEQKLIGWFG